MDDFLQMYMDIPPVTRFYVTACLIVNGGAMLNYISWTQLYFNYNMILKGELWRIITNFLYVGPMGLHFMFHFLFLYRYSRNLEEGSFRGRTADFVFFFLFGMFLLTIAATFVNVIFLGTALNQMFVYVWARRNPYIRMAFFGMLNFQAPYLPYVLTMFSLALGSSVLIDVLGIVCGHIYYYLEDVFPNIEGGFRILVTPAFMKRIFDPIQEVNRVATENEAGNGPGGFDWGEDQ